MDAEPIQISSSFGKLQTICCRTNQHQTWWALIQRINQVPSHGLFHTIF